MRSTVWVVASLLIICSVIAVGLVLLGRKGKDTSSLVLYGNVDVRQVDIGFRVAGQVATLFVEEGDRVKQGDKIALLDATPYDEELKAAVAKKEATRVNLENADILLIRRQHLIKVGGVSQEDLDNALATRDQLRAALDQAEAEVKIAEDRLSYTEVFAPTEGVILTRIREPGTVVNPADPVVTLSVSSPVWIRAFVDEPDLGKVYYGMPAKIYTDIEGGEIYKGKVGFISPVAEFTPKTVQSTQLRTDLVYRLRIYADNPDQHLVQGMPVTVKLRLKTARPIESAYNEEYE